MEEYIKNTNDIKVLTPTGFSKFDGIALMKQDSGVKITFDDNTVIQCTADHKIFIDENSNKVANELKIGDTVKSSHDSKTIISKEYIPSDNVYDLINVENDNRFFVNNTLVSNCFLTFEETLIKSTKLFDLEGKEPLYKTGGTRWYKEPVPGMIYTVALDPSLGTGGDPAAIQIFEANSTIQIGEWTHNKTDCPSQIRIMADIVNHIFEKTNDVNSTYYSIENNTIGEAALLSLESYGEHNISGVMLSQAKLGNANKRFRKGFNTTNKSKLAACSKFKNLVESDKMQINSFGLVSEMKNFVASGVTYKAKLGEHDDLVMACLLSVRMMDVLTDYHRELSTHLSEYDPDLVKPFPFMAIL